jgi:UDP-N-acetylglucosamine diphosphorylase/glucosamine-1-phosphate N-acetyltransferase
MLGRIVETFEPDEVALWCRPYLAEMARTRNPAARVNTPLEGEWVLLNGRWFRGDRDAIEREGQWFIEADGAVAVAKLTMSGESPGQHGEPPGEVLGSLPQVSGDVHLFRYLWELVEVCADEVSASVSRLELGGKLDGHVEPGAVLLDEDSICLAPGSRVGAGAVLDARGGPIWVSRDASIGPLAVIEGPCYLGSQSVVNATARVRGGCAFGSGVRIGGEIENAIILEFTNKQHDGFLGHSYLGSWINLGAGTTNSDLKNNYHPVRVRFGDDEVSTGRLKVGLFMGDHSTTGIGTLFTTGASVGVGCNLLGGGLMPKYVRSFAWGHPREMTDYRLPDLVETARTMMGRRGAALSTAYGEVLQELHRRTTRC